MALAKGDVVIINGKEKNRGLWKLGIVKELVTGRDGVVSGAKLRAGRSYLERPVQHLYPMELSCDRTTATPRAALSAEAPVFRPSRDVAVAARARIKDATELTDDDHWSLNISIRDIATMIRTTKLFTTIRDEQGESVMKQECSVILFLLDFVINSVTRLSERQRTWWQIGLKTKGYRFKEVTILGSVWASPCTVRIEAVK